MLNFLTLFRENTEITTSWQKWHTVSAIFSSLIVIASMFACLKKRGAVSF